MRFPLTALNTTWWRSKVVTSILNWKINLQSFDTVCVICNWVIHTRIIREDYIFIWGWCAVLLTAHKANVAITPFMKCWVCTFSGKGLRWRSEDFPLRGLLVNCESCLIPAMSFSLPDVSEMTSFSVVKQNIWQRTAVVLLVTGFPPGWMYLLMILINK